MSTVRNVWDRLYRRWARSGGVHLLPLGPWWCRRHTRRGSPGTDRRFLWWLPDNFTALVPPTHPPGQHGLLRSDSPFRIYSQLLNEFTDWVRTSRPDLPLHLGPWGFILQAPMRRDPVTNASYYDRIQMIPITSETATANESIMKFWWHQWLLRTRADAQQRFATQNDGASLADDGSEPHADGTPGARLQITTALWPSFGNHGNSPLRHTAGHHPTRDANGHRCGKHRWSAHPCEPFGLHSTSQREDTLQHQHHWLVGHWRSRDLRAGPTGDCFTCFPILSHLFPLWVTYRPTHTSYP